MDVRPDPVALRAGAVARLDELHTLHLIAMKIKEENKERNGAERVDDVDKENMAG